MLCGAVAWLVLDPARRTERGGQRDGVAPAELVDFRGVGLGSFRAGLVQPPGPEPVLPERVFGRHRQAIVEDPQVYAGVRPHAGDDRWRYVGAVVLRSAASRASPTRSQASRFGARTVLPVDSVDVVWLFLVYGRRGRRPPMLFSIQSLIAVAVTVGVAVVWTMAIAVTGAIWQRHEIREFMASHPLTIASQDSTQADDARELVLR